MIQLNYNANHHHHHHHHHSHHTHHNHLDNDPNSRNQENDNQSTSVVAKFELSDDNNNIISSAEDLNNYTLTNSQYSLKDTDDAENSSKVEDDVTDLSVSSSSSASMSFDDELMGDVKPKKSCLVRKSKLFIDTNVSETSSTNGDHLTAETSDIISETANATSSPLFSDSGFPSSPSITSSSAASNSNQSSNMSLSISSIQPPQTLNEPSSPINTTTCLSSSPTASVSFSSSSSSSKSQPAAISKKRVLFADSCGKELFTIRTMSEPSNCPPKLTSKIVQYFLNREFNSSANDLAGMVDGMELGSNGMRGVCPRQTHSANDLNHLASGNSYNRSSEFFSLSRSYDYGISALNYTNDVNQLSGSIAVYSLNFAQPAGDYLLFRKRLEENFVSLENVVLNLFQINGTIKVKNIDFHKNIFVRCSFDGWKTYEDYQAEYVPNDFYSSLSSHSSFSPSSPTHSSSATFYVSSNSSYMPQHKEYDTFRFEFQLPKTVHQAANSSNEKNTNKDVYSDFGYGGRNLNLTASIQMCVCYRSGQGSELQEFWDSNHGKNYEILQYVIDIERLKPKSKKSQSQPTKQGPGKSSSFSPLTHHESLFDFENVNGAWRSDSKLSGMYY